MFAPGPTPLQHSGDLEFMQELGANALGFYNNLTTRFGREDSLPPLMEDRRDLSSIDLRIDSISLWNCDDVRCSKNMRNLLIALPVAVIPLHFHGLCLCTRCHKHRLEQGVHNTPSHRLKFSTSLGPVSIYLILPQHCTVQVSLHTWRLRSSMQN